MFRYLFLSFILTFLVSCSSDVQPKPKGELRLEYPEAKYVPFSSECSFSFEHSDFAKIHQAKQACWYNVVYPTMRANIFVTYFPIKNDFNLHIKEVEKMVYEHTIRASAIDTKSSSNIQIYITDSTRHFVTANLYFKSRPRPDSLQPAVEYIKKDLMHMIESFEWKHK